MVILLVWVCCTDVVFSSIDSPIIQVKVVEGEAGTKILSICLFFASSNNFRGQSCDRKKIHMILAVIYFRDERENVQNYGIVENTRPIHNFQSRSN